jgi:cysteinyl-tRNA synthetase
MAAYKERFFEALRDDFNTPAALAAAFEWIREANSRSEVGRDDLVEMLTVLGLENLLEPETVEVGGDAEELLRAREEARAAKDFAEADRLRDELRSRGWEVRDGPSGPELVPVP